MGTLQTNQGVMFDAKSAAVIAKVVKAANRQQGALQTAIRSPNVPNEKGFFYAAINAEDPSNTGFYSWKKYDVINGLPTVSDPLTQDTLYSAQELNHTGGIVTGILVRMYFAGYDDDLDGSPARYLFEIGGSLPQGQYEGMVFGDVTTSQTGFFFPSATPMDGS